MLLAFLNLIEISTIEHLQHGYTCLGRHVTVEFIIIAYAKKAQMTDTLYRYDCSPKDTSWVKSTKCPIKAKPVESLFFRALSHIQYKKGRTGY